MTTSRTFEASAPGRLDVMGGIADYSGALVLQMPIREHTTVKVNLRSDFICTFTSETGGDTVSVTLNYTSLLRDGQVDHAHAREMLKHSWVAYVIGCALILQQSKNILFTGADFHVRSNVPLGKGVSSSASLEVATMRALAQAFSLSFTGTELPVLAQQVENLIVGAPCGLMDQLASAFGERGKLLPILCQPDKVSEPVVIPQDIAFVGIDSGVRHSVGGASYGDVRCAAFMGYTIILDSLGVTRQTIDAAVQANDLSALPFGGYLCNIAVSDFESRFKSILPVSLGGQAFLDRYGLTVDRITGVKKDAHYAIRDCTAHPVYEHQRVQRFLQRLTTVSKDGRAGRDAISELGALMYEAHESYSRCGLGSERTDEIVSMAKDLHREGIAGAKITGGGSGGTVCLLTIGEEGKKAARRIHQKLCDKYGAALAMFE